MQYQALANYANTLYQILVNVEEGGTVKLTPYADGRGFVTIGVGFNLHDASVRDVILPQLGVTIGSAQYNSLVSILSQPYAANALPQSVINQLNAAISPTRASFAFADVNEVRTAYDALVPTYVNWVTAEFPNVLATSREHAVLVSLHYNETTANPVIGGALRNAITSGNRAEAWYEIRYRSNGGADQGGVAKRRYYESQMFGLYDDTTGTAAILEPEAKAIYQIYTNRRDLILNYEEAFGGGTGTDRIAQANANYTGAQVQHLEDALARAAQPLINRYAAGRGDINALDILIGNDVSDIITAHARIGYVLNSNGEANSATLIIGEGGNDTLTGGWGDDVIWGGDDEDTLDGRSGVDHLYGGSDNDTLNGVDGNTRDFLNGGSGFDTYYADNDRIVDEAGGGRVYYGSAHVLLTGGTRQRAGQQFVSSDGTVVYDQEPDGTVAAHTASGVIRITELGKNAQGRSIQVGEGLETGLPGMGISLVTDPGPEDQPGNPPNAGPVPAAEYEWAMANAPSPSPIALDLDGDGIESRGIGAGAFFDFAGDGFAEQVGWVGGDDGMLVRDLNGDGKINNGGELFGDYTLLLNGNRASNGYQALAEHDVNQDGRIDAADSIWNELKIWRDLDTDGFADAGELSTLAVSGVQAIGVGYHAGTGIDSHRNDFRLESSYVRSDGSVGVTADIWFRANPSNSIQENPIVVAEAFQDQPELHGYGKVYDLRQAMTVDTTGQLVDLVGDFIAAQDATTRKAALAELLLVWTNSEDIDPTSRGPNIDARILNVIESFMGQGFIQQGIWTNPQARPAPVLQGVYQEIFNKHYLDLMRQTHLRDVFDSVELSFDSTSNSAIADLSQSVPLFASRFAVSQDEGLTAVAEFILGVRRYYNVTTAERAEFESSISIYGQDAATIANVAWDGLFATSGADRLTGKDTDEYINGLGGDDNISGGRGHDTLEGGDGNDLIMGDDGNDVIDGQAGDDVFYGGLGNDTYVFGNGSGHDSIALITNMGSTNEDSVRFGPGVSAADVSLRRSGDDLTLVLNNGADTFLIPSYFKGDGISPDAPGRFNFADNSFWTFADIRTLLLPIGTAGNDSLYGYSTPDTIRGLAGDDYIEARSGNDLISGDLGNDTLAGGNGSDVYEFNAGDGHDTILENSSIAGDLDVLRLGTGLTTGNIHIAKDGANLEITFNGNSTDQITLVNWLQSTYTWAESDTTQVERIEFADGTIWNLQDIRAHIDFQGTSGEDFIRGTDGDDVIDGFAGNDRIQAFGGDDTLIGGDGDDRLEAYSGDDILIGGTGNDVLIGDYGNDTYIFSAGSGSDVVVNHWSELGSLETIRFTEEVTPSSVRVSRDDGNVYLHYNNESDRIEINGWWYYSDAKVGRVEFADGTVWTMSEIESLANTPDNFDNYVYGTSGSDVLNGMGGFDVIRGFEGNDVINGGAGFDEMFGGTGSDTYLFGEESGQDIFYEELAVGDVNLVVFEAGITTSDVTFGLSFGYYLDVNIVGTDSHFRGGWINGGTYAIDRFQFSNGTIWTAADVLANLSGDSYDNVLTGNAQGNSLNGFGGNDEIHGLGGNDVLTGGAGIDSLYGDAGDDVYVFGPGSELDHVYETNGTASDVDTIKVAAGVLPSQLFASSDGVDLTLSLNSTDRIVLHNWFTTPSSQIERVEFSNGVVWGIPEITARLLVGDETNNVITGTAGDDEILGNGGYDVLYGAGGSDTLLGGNDDDSLYGDAGDDTLDGGQGNDVLQGGAGADTYKFGIGGGFDYIYESSGVAGETDTVQFGSGINPANITISLEGPFLRVTLASSLEQLNIYNWQDGSNGIERFTFADGTTWDRVAIGNNISSNQNISGTAGDDTLIGGLGNDTLYAGGGNDTLIGGGGNDSLNADDGDDTLNGGAGTDQLSGGLGSDTYLFNAGFGSDTITEFNYVPGSVDIVRFGSGLNSTDVQLSRPGNDLIMSFNAGANQVTIQQWSFGPDNSIEQYEFGDGVIWGHQQVFDRVSGATSGGDYINGTGFGEAISGLGGNDTIAASNGDDVISGGTGNDTLYGESGSDTYLFNLGDGQDVIGLSNDSTVSTETIIFGAGIAAADVQVLKFGNDLTLQIRNATDSITAQSHFGSPDFRMDVIQFADGTTWDFNAIQSRVGIQGDSNGNTISGTSANDYIYGLGGNDNLNGGAGIDVVDGGDGDDVVDGGLGADTLYGGAGNDTFVVDSTSDTVIEYLNQGTDLVQSSATFALGNNIENLTLTSTGNVNATGNALNNALIGNSGNNILDGGAGLDSMNGGAGNDTYVVDNALDTVTESSSTGGTDLVQSSVTFTLGANLENLTLTGSAAINGTGNGLANIIDGSTNSAANVLTGDAGNDTYIVGAGDTAVETSSSGGTDLVQSYVTFTLGNNVENLTLIGSDAITGTGNTLSNTIIGNNGNNTLDAGTAGTDSLQGGLGDDTYVVGRSSGITIVENAGAGVDTVKSSVTFTIASLANLENITLTGSTAINATGNGNDNVLDGSQNSAVNSLTGGAGNDTFIVGSNDTVSESSNGGIDTISSASTFTLASSVENLFLTGNATANATGLTTANWLKGNIAANTLTGGGGNDLLFGDAGVDTLTGGTAKELLIGGADNDAITTNSGVDVIAFNKGDGSDTVAVSTTKDNVLSIGGGALYADLLFQKVGNDLVLKVGGSDQITFTGYYASASNRSVNTLQVVIDGTSDYLPGGGNTTRDNRVERFNFDGLVTAFDSARTANPSLTTWALTNALASNIVGGSNTQAIGGEAAYQYARNGNLNGLSVTQVSTLLADANFASGLQNFTSIPGPMGFMTASPIETMSTYQDRADFNSAILSSDTVEISSDAGLDPILIYEVESEEGVAGLRDKLWTNDDGGLRYAPKEFNMETTIADLMSQTISSKSFAALTVKNSFDSASEESAPTLTSWRLAHDIAQSMEESAGVDVSTILSNSFDNGPGLLSALRASPIGATQLAFKSFTEARFEEQIAR